MFITRRPQDGMCVFMLKNQNLYKLKIHNHFSVVFFTGNLVTVWQGIYFTYQQVSALSYYCIFYCIISYAPESRFIGSLLYRFMLKKDSNAEELFILRLKTKHYAK